jgi:hypothetical protein
MIVDEKTNSRQTELEDDPTEGNMAAENQLRARSNSTAN